MYARRMAQSASLLSITVCDLEPRTRLLEARLSLIAGPAGFTRAPHLAADLAATQIACHRLREQLAALQKEVDSLHRSVVALWDFVTPESPPAALHHLDCLD